MKLTLILLTILALTAGAINWTYPNELALDLRVKTAEFLRLYEMACTGTFVFNGIVYDLPEVALTAVRAATVTAYGDMTAAQTAIKAWATE